MTHSKDTRPAQGDINIQGGIDLFDVADLPKLHELAGVPETQVRLAPEEIAWRLRDAFMGAIISGALAKSAAPPAQNRDYLARIAEQAEALCRDLGMRDPQNRQHPEPLPLELLKPDDNDSAIRYACAGGSASDAKPIVPITARDLLAMEIQPREMLMAPWLPCHGAAMVFAGRGIGKTYLAMSIAYTVATGGSLLRWAAPASRRVLYVDGEMPLGSLQERLAGIIAGAGREPPDPDSLAFLPQDFYRDGLPDLASEAGQALIKQFAEGRDLVVFDNLSSLVRVKENEADAWQPMQDLVLWLRRQRVSTLIVHHAGKTGGQRGTSRREDVMDSVIELRRPDDYDPAQGARFEVHFTKARGFTGAEAAPFVANMTKDAEGPIRWEDSDPKADGKAVAFEMFTSGAKAGEVEKALDVGRATAFRWQRDWKESGGHG